MIAWLAEMFITIRDIAYIYTSDILSAMAGYLLGSLVAWHKRDSGAGWRPYLDFGRRSQMALAIAICVIAVVSVFQVAVGNARLAEYIERQAECNQRFLAEIEMRARVQREETDALRDLARGVAGGLSIADPQRQSGYMQEVITGYQERVAAAEESRGKGKLPDCQIETPPLPPSP